MKIHIPLIITAFLLLFTIESRAQTNENSNPLENGSIIEQFDYTVNKSSRYEEYRVVKSYWLSKLRSNVLDTITSLEKKIDELLLNSNIQQQKTDSLISLLKETRVSLDNAIKEKNTLTFLGINMSKSSYQNITFSIIIILILGLAGVFAIYKKSIFVTNETKETLKDLQEEFDEHRKRTLEREKTMARNHLNELNKLRNK